MLLFLILAMFFILHAQFLLRNIFFGTYDSTFFQFTQPYLFDRHIATMSLLFVLLCAGAFQFGYKYAYKAYIQPQSVGQTLDDNIRAIVRICLFFGVTQALANFGLAAISGFSYQRIAETLEASAFVFELRIVFLLCFAYITLNVPFRILWSDHKYRLLRAVVIFYTLSLLVVQSRSRVFELAAVPIFAHLMWNGDRVRWRYVGVLVLALIAPNLIVLGRLGIPSSPGALISGLFSIEYSVLLDNFLGGAIEGRYVVQEHLTFLKSLWLVIPSPIRSLLGIEVIKSDAYIALSRIADVRNGGYSMLAEMYQNFGWYAVAVFGLMGFFLGALNRRASSVGNVPIVAATAPLIYAAFIIAFRNDFGVFLKFIVQVFLVALLLRFALRISLPPQTRSTPSTSATGKQA